MKLASFIESGYIDQPFCFVMGTPIEHSLSPEIHNLAARSHNLDWTYYKVEVADDEMEEASSLFHLKNFVGANVTIPHKRSVMKYLDMVKKSAQAVNAVNTVVRKAGILAGYNTDEYGFAQPLLPCADLIKHGSAIVFGTGGTSSAVMYALTHYFMVDKIYLVTRDVSDKTISAEPVTLIDYSMVSDFIDDANIIINASPMGMKGYPEESPLDSDLMPRISSKICYDLVYNPLQTRFLKEAREQGATTINGLPMFIHQAAKSFELWTGEIFPVDEAGNLVMNKLKSNID